MVDSSLQLLSHFLKVQIKLNTPFPFYDVSSSPEANAFNAGINYGLRKVLDVLSTFKSSEELSEYLISIETAMECQAEE